MLNYFKLYFFCTRPVNLPRRDNRIYEDTVKWRAEDISYLQVFISFVFLNSMRQGGKGYRNNEDILNQIKMNLVACYLKFYGINFHPHAPVTVYRHQQLFGLWLTLALACDFGLWLFIGINKRLWSVNSTIILFVKLLLKLHTKYNLVNLEVVIEVVLSNCKNNHTSLLTLLSSVKFGSDDRHWTSVGLQVSFSKVLWHFSF